MGPLHKFLWGGPTFCRKRRSRPVLGDESAFDFAKRDENENENFTAPPEAPAQSLPAAVLAAGAGNPASAVVAPAGHAGWAEQSPCHFTAGRQRRGAGRKGCRQHDLSGFHDQDDDGSAGHRSEPGPGHARDPARGDLSGSAGPECLAGGVSARGNGHGAGSAVRGHAALGGRVLRSAGPGGERQRGSLCGPDEPESGRAGDDRHTFLQPHRSARPGTCFHRAGYGPADGSSPAERDLPQAVYHGAVYRSGHQLPPAGVHDAQHPAEPAGRHRAAQWPDPGR